MGLARAFLAASVPVAAICGATAGLARGGLLDTRKHASAARPITASPTGALEFARAIFERLDVFAPDALDAWYGLYRTGEPRHYFALMQALSR